MKKFRYALYQVARHLAAVILLQTLYFKFSASEESVYIFTTIGVEPWGRIVVGIFELVAGILLLIPATAWIGAGLSLGLMAGAIGMHLTILGVDVLDDGGYLFALSVVVSLCSAYVLSRSADRIIAVASRFRLTGQG